MIRQIKDFTEDELTFMQHQIDFVGIRRIKRLATIVDHIVSSRSNLACLKDASPLLPLEYYFEKEKVILLRSDTVSE